MPRFGIASPILGLKTDVPGIALMEAWTPDNNNVRVQDGEIQRVKMPVVELAEEGSGTATGAAIATPRYSYAVTALAANTFTIAGDHHADFVDGDAISVVGSTDNDDAYTVDGNSVFDVDHTDITVVESVDTSDADGHVWKGATPVLHYHHLVAHSEDIEYVFAFTAYHIFRWVAATLTLECVHTCASACAHWSSVSFNECVIATNNVDAPQRWQAATPAADFATLTGSPTYVDKAKFVTAFENMVMFGYITEGVTACPARTRWCDIGNETAWAGGNAGYADVGGADSISGGFGRKGDFNIVFKDAHIHQMWLVSGTDIFNISELPGSIGSKAPDSVVNDADGRLYFYATDGNFRELDAGEVSAPIDKMIRNIAPANVGIIRSTFLPEYNEIWWAVPYLDDLAQNNRILKWKAGVWNKSEMSVSAFGAYLRQSGVVWDTLPYDTWEEWAWDTWDSAEGEKGARVDLVGDYNGVTWAAHASQLAGGSAYEGSFVLETDLTAKEELTSYKRISHVETYWRPGASAQTATIQVKRDGEPNWQDLDEIEISGTSEWVVVKSATDFRAKSFQFRVACSAPFAFLGMLLDFSLSGRR